MFSLWVMAKSGAARYFESVFDRSPPFIAILLIDRSWRTAAHAYAHHNHKEDNDTPVQSQSERDKTVAGNEGGSGRPSVGVELPWCQFAADRLATSLRETHLHLGVSRTNRDASIIKPNTRRSIETENCLCSPDLKNFLVFG